MRTRPTSVATFALALALGPACAADTAPAKPEPLSASRTLVAQKKWGAAVDELRRVNDTGSATGTT